MANELYSIAVFPFLKTSGAVSIGGFTFRSTLDTAELPSGQAKAVAEIADMLFLKDDLRVKSASYAIVPFIEPNRAGADLDRLGHLRDVVAYFYSAPHVVFGNVFLTLEQVSLAVFTPHPVSVFLVRPDHHVEAVSTALHQQPNERYELTGYAGLYNFRYPFWVVAGSRLYGPTPHIGLNISQDLLADFGTRLSGRPDYDLLLRLLDKPLTPTALRVFSALHWFSAANEDAADPDKAILNLAIAFEALLRLPDPLKTERLVDAIALLLGRTERLEEWARQFYGARSSVAHEGRANYHYYYVPKSVKQKQPSGVFGSLLLYGREIFQLCLGTLLVGVDLAERTDLQERFVSNTERFEKICQILEPKTGTAVERLEAIEPAVRALQRYRFVASAETSHATMIGAVKYASETLLDCDIVLTGAIKDALRAVVSAKRENGELAELKSIEELNAAFDRGKPANQTPQERVVQDLVELAWSNMFQY